MRGHMVCSGFKWISAHMRGGSCWAFCWDGLGKDGDKVILGGLS
ncbi:MAG TPA: hypothetical protein PLX23_04130 [Candidatus Hydrogenedens sp.]|nr:hypothetical protein [Candidatus Hydrogenedens sp.]